MAPQPAGLTGIDISTFLFFIGAPRSGTTLLGQLLNMHPNCLIANEHRTLDQVFRKGALLGEALTEATSQAMREFVTGLEHSERFSPTLDRYQPKWRDTSNLRTRPELRKGTLRVVGDKKAGGTAQLFKEFRAPFLEMVRACPELRFLHILRDPVHAAVSMQESHKVEEFGQALEHILEGNELGAQLADLVGDQYLLVGYENLQSDPRAVLADILGWLELPADGPWLDMVAGVVNPSTRKPWSEDQTLALEQRLPGLSHPNLYAPYRQR